jgi:large subunit ribosomal protein L31
MKKDTHPKYNTKAKITCSCGTVIEVGSTMKEISTELCSACHPFYTGEQRLVDTARRVEKFEEKLAKTKTVVSVNKGKTAKRKAKAAKKTEK